MTTHRVYTHIDETDFYDMIHRAKIEDCFVDANGKVDIGSLLSLLIHTYATGEYKIIPREHSLATKMPANDEVINVERAAESLDVVADKLQK